MSDEIYAFFCARSRKQFLESLQIRAVSISFIFTCNSEQNIRTLNVFGSWKDGSAVVSSRCSSEDLS